VGNRNNGVVYRPAERSVSLDMKRKSVTQLHRQARPGIQGQINKDHSPVPFGNLPAFVPSQDEKMTRQRCRVWGALHDDEAIYQC
jgi:hypothetical protein